MPLSFRDEASATKKQVFTFDDWDTRRTLAWAIRDYFRTVGTAWTPKHRVGVIKALRVFLRYLKTEFIEADRLSVMEFLTAGYVEWLDENDAMSERTKANRFAVVIRLLDHCMRTPHLAPALPSNFKLPVNPWSRAYAEAEPRHGLPRDQLALIRAKCARDIAMIRAKLRLGAEIRADVGMALPERKTKVAANYRDQRVRIAALHSYYGGKFNRESIRRHDPGLGKALDKDAGGTDAVEHLHFTSQTIVPFVLLLAIDTMFNPDTILGLEWKDVERDHPVFGKDRWRIGGQKARAHRKQYRSFASNLTDDATTIQVLLSLERFAAPARKDCAAHLRDRVFVFVTRKGRFTSYEGKTSHGDTNLWKLALAAFRARHDLPYFTLSDLRKAAGNLMVDIAGGDIKAQQNVMGHASVDTTFRNYHSPEARVSDRESLAERVNEHERHAIGERIVVAPDVAVPDARSSVTPGFGCINPKESPIPGQREDRMCDAYGACPACGNSRVDFGSSHVLGRLLQLRARMMDLRSVTHPERWNGIWRHRLDALERLCIAPFPPDIRAAAEALRLPPLPRLE